MEILPPTTQRNGSKKAPRDVEMDLEQQCDGPSTDEKHPAAAVVSPGSPQPVLAALKPNRSPGTKRARLRDSESAEPLLRVTPIATSRHAIAAAGGVAHIVSTRGNVDLAGALSATAAEVCLPFSAYHDLVNKLSKALSLIHI